MREKIKPWLVYFSRELSNERKKKNIKPWLIYFLKELSWVTDHSSRGLGVNKRKNQILTSLFLKELSRVIDF